MPPTLARHNWPVRLPGVLSVLAERHRQFAAEREQWLFEDFSEAPLAGHALAKIPRGSASDHCTILEAVDGVMHFVYCDGEA